jgi:hypothetical protein
MVNLPSLDIPSCHNARVPRGVVCAVCVGVRKQEERHPEPVNLISSPNFNPRLTLQSYET